MSFGQSLTTSVCTLPCRLQMPKTIVFQPRCGWPCPRLDVVRSSSHRPRRDRGRDAPTRTPRPSARASRAVSGFHGVAVRPGNLRDLDRRQSAATCRRNRRQATSEIRARMLEFSLSQTCWLGSASHDPRLFIIFITSNVRVPMSSERFFSMCCANKSFFSQKIWNQFRRTK